MKTLNKLSNGNIVTAKQFVVCPRCTRYHVPNETTRRALACGSEGDLTFASAADAFAYAMRGNCKTVELSRQRRRRRMPGRQETPVCVGEGADATRFCNCLKKGALECPIADRGEKTMVGGMVYATRLEAINEWNDRRSERIKNQEERRAHHGANIVRARLNIQMI